MKDKILKILDKVGERSLFPSEGYDAILDVFQEEKMELVEKIIKIFRPYANEPMTGNVVILELQVVLAEIQEKEEVGG